MMTLIVLGLLNEYRNLASLSEIYKLLGVVDKDEVRCQDMFEFVSKNKRKCKTNRVGFKKTN